jgi:hypothetical protein
MIKGRAGRGQRQLPAAMLANVSGGGCVRDGSVFLADLHGPKSELTK